MSDHNPTADFGCVSCDGPWPCETRRRELRAECADTPSVLVHYLTAAMIQACYVLPNLSAGQLHYRFLGWLDRRRSPANEPHVYTAASRGANSGPLRHER